MHVYLLIYVQAANAALINFFETLRTELGNQVGITVVTPGWIESEMSKGRYLKEHGEMEVDQEMRDVSDNTNTDQLMSSAIVLEGTNNTLIDMLMTNMAMRVSGSDRSVPCGVRQELRQGHGAGSAARRAIPHRAGVVQGNVPVAGVRAGGRRDLLPPPVHARPWRQAGQHGEQDDGRVWRQAAAVPDLAAIKSD